MRNILNGIETLTVTRKPYNPMPNMFMEFLPTLWINECTGETFIAVGRDGCITNIQPINSDFEGIEEILTQCGIVKADEDKKIEVEGECGIRAMADDCPDFCINLLTGYGLKGGGQICKGETRTIELDADITGDVRGPDAANVGDVPVFDTTDGKSITTSNINSVDGLTKITKTTLGEQKLLVENTAGNDSVVQAKTTGNGYSYIQLSNNNDEWFASLNPSQKQIEIFPRVSGENKSPILTMLPNGVMLMPWQPKLGATFGTAKLDQANVSRDIGGFGGGTFTTILDQDGYNLSAGNFYPGDGAGQGAFYTTTYDNAFYLVVIQFLVQKDDRNAGATTNIAIQYQGTPSYIFRKELISGIKFETFVGVTVLRGVKGNKISFSLDSTNQNIEITNFGGGVRENYIGIYMLG